jgi:type III pantothenate kinase
VLAEIGAASPPPSRAIGCTVVNGGLEPLAAVLQGRGIRLELAGRDLPCPLATAYADPSTLGCDRWVSALAGFTGFGACVVVQCGTAITVDAVDAGGRFLGGAIAPGLGAMARGLAVLAPALPAFAAPAAAVPAVSSEACVQAGVTLAFVGAVERLVDEVAASLPAGSARLLTGGDAELYVRHGRRRLTHVPDLLHRGLRCLAQTCGPPC